MTSRVLAEAVAPIATMAAVASAMMAVRFDMTAGPVLATGGVRSLTPVECAPAHIRCTWLSTSAQASGPQISADTQLEGHLINVEHLCSCSCRGLFGAVFETSHPGCTC